MSAPRATMRLQFHKGFSFADATALVPYLSALGISHLYASPIMTARSGSAHGYDVVDPTHINPELGGEDGLRQLVGELRRHDMGLIVDIVPNHMAVGRDNPWWNDVLAHGRNSRYASFFDIDWEPDDRSLHGRVLVPILGRPYGEALAAGEIRLYREQLAGFVVRYFDHVLPISPRCEIDREALSQFDPATADGRDHLHRLLERQHYRLAWWRTANDEINWRRFFDINDLAALRVEDDEVFETIHATLFQLYADGLVDGIRVDHIDGLSRPEQYCRKIRERLGQLECKRPVPVAHGRAYFVVEKILGRNEELAGSWETDGTTGYDFMDSVTALLHDPAGEKPLGRLWERISGRTAVFATEEERSRRQTLERSFSAQFDSTVRAFHELARSSLTLRDFTRAAIRRVLTEILAHFPVYRIYASIDNCSDTDRKSLTQAIEDAKVTCLPGDHPVIDHIGRWLAGDRVCPQLDRLQAVALTRFQQLSAPLSAKAVEDTAFYRYGRLLSRNDVGFDARRFACSAGEFHKKAEARLGRFPRSLLATATHDHKRGEDVRARLAVLSEAADEWTERVERWIAQSTHLRLSVDGELAPAPGDLAILFQTIVGAWPPDLTLDDVGGLMAFGKRIERWQEKALREAKLASDWSIPNEAYENAAKRLVARLFAGESGLLSDVAAFARRIATAGAANGLAQTLLKLTAPGVPDCYQGSEYWDLSLVDPDNRAAVNFDARRRTLHARPLTELASDWEDGRIKQALIARVLAIRQAAPRLFSEGAYLPIQTAGPLANHLVAFARIFNRFAAITLTCRFTCRLLGAGESLTIPSAIWKDTQVILPADIRAMTLFDCLVGTVPDSKEGVLDLGQIFTRLPVALLVRQADADDLSQRTHAVR